MTAYAQYHSQIPEQLRKTLLEAAMPPPARTALDWVESDDGPVLSERTSGVSGKLNLDITPYLRFPLEQFSNPSVERMSLCFGTQTGKTTFLQCVIGYIIDHDPGPTMFVRPTMTEAQDFSKDRMMPFITDCPSLIRHIPGRIEEHLRPLEYRMDRMTMRYAWSQSEVSVRSHPIRYLIKDESSAYAPGASALADERTKTFWNRKIIETSTPSADTDTIWRFMGLERKPGLKPEDVFRTDSYETKTATSVYFLEVPCPHCGQFIRLEASQLRWPKDMALRDIESHGWYECQVCGGKITDAQKAYAVRAGIWNSDNPGGKWVGFHLNSLYAPWPSCRFGAVAFEMINARRSNDYEVLKSFVNNWLALPYSLEDLGADVVTLTSIENSKCVRYLKNEIPAAVRALTIGVDVQADKLYWTLIGWNARKDESGNRVMESWILSWGESENFDVFRANTLMREWSHESGEKLRIVAGGMDGRYRTAEVKAFCAANPVVAVVFGEQTIRKSAASTSATPFSATQIDRDSHGKALPNSRVGYRLNTTYWKQWLYQRMNKIGDSAVHHIPANDDHDSRMYIRHISSEVEIPERVRGSTEIRRVWRVRKGYEANHWLDATVYGSAIALVRGVFGISEESGLVGKVANKQKTQQKEKKYRPPIVARRQR